MSHDKRATHMIEIGTTRQLFVDRYIVDRMTGAGLFLHEPREEGVVLRYDRPWEGVFSGAGAVLRDGGEYRLYYRAMPAVADGDPAECTCVAVSADGHHWERPELGLFELNGNRRNNAVLAHCPPFSHNFMPFLDTRPDVPEAERYKAVAGVHKSGVCMFVSADGVRWRRLSDAPGITSEPFAFDSYNVAFWSEQEGCYVCYFRTWKDGIRWVSRSTSDDFVHWGPSEEMVFHHEGSEAPAEQVYTNGTHPYFRAPQVYVAIPRRYMAGRTILSNEEAEALSVHPAQRDSCSDAVFMTSRGGNVYDRTFLEAFLRPGPDRGNWSSRAGTVAAGVVQTGEREMSVYRNGHYGAPSNHLRRYSLRLDGFVSVRASCAGGELLTKPFTFAGGELVLNCETSAAGGIRVELQDEAGAPQPGFTLAEADEIVGDEIDRVVSWQGRAAVPALGQRGVRLRFQMMDADLYGFRFRG